jgi:uncharacterized membrane protein YesL
MRLRLGLLFWTLGILFPMSWLGRFSSTYRRLFDAIFGPGWMHVLMHLALFAGLGALLVIASKAGLTRRAALAAVGLILVVAVLQEGFQALSQGTLSQGVSFEQAEILKRAAFDVVVDLAGGLVGLSLALRLRRTPLTMTKQE